MIEAITKTLIVDDRYKFILEGLFNTLLISIIATIVGTLIGVIIALIHNNYDQNKKGKILNSLCNLYVSIIRGTPLVLQLIIIYYFIFKSVDINIVLSGVIAFSLNSAAYVCEIFW